MTRVAHLEGDGLSGSFLEFVPTAVDKWLGDSAEPDVVKELGGLYEDPRAQAHVSGLGQSLVKQTKNPDYGFTFKIINSDDVNAFALPNGSIFVTKGLLTRLKTDAQLANVLGHEIAHVTERHGIEQMSIDMGTLGLLEMASQIALRKVKPEKMERFGSLVDTAKGVIFQLASTGYSRYDEAQSDKEGQEFAAKAGYDPRGMVETMQVFASLSPTEPHAIERYFMSHPYAVERAEAAEKRANKLSLYPGIKEAGNRSYAQFLNSSFGIPMSQTLAPGTAGFFTDVTPLEGLLYVVGILGAGLAVVFLVRR